jgi:hypothetical protein
MDRLVLSVILMTGYTSHDGRLVVCKADMAFKVYCGGTWKGIENKVCLLNIPGSMAEVDADEVTA